MARISEPALGVSMAIARCGWYGGVWASFMVEYMLLCIYRIVPPEQRLVCLS